MAKYSYEFKKKLVLAYLNNEGGYRYLCKVYGLPDTKINRQWVNLLRAAGPDALRPHKKGRKKTLDKSKKDNKTQETEESIIDTNAAHIKN